jgi:hypothetical protein
MVARDAEKNILGRAIVWEKVLYEDSDNWPITNFSVLDRVYYSHDFIIKMIRNYAQSIGIDFRKKRNDNATTDEFVALKDVHALCLVEGDTYHNSSLSIKVPASQWHKQGAPYLDTFCLVLK